MKTAISIPDKIFIAAEGVAKRLGISRSEFYAKAVEEFLKAHKNKNVTEQLNLVYEETDSTLDEQLLDLQSKSIPREKW